MEETWLLHIFYKVQINLELQSLPYGRNLSILQDITPIKCQEDVAHHLHLLTVMSPAVIELTEEG